MNPVTSAMVGKAVVRGAGHWIMRAVSVFVVFALGWMIWTNLIQPHTKWRIPTSTTNQSAEKISNYYLTMEEDNCWIKFLGVKALCFKQEVKIPVVTQEENVTHNN